MIQSGTGKPGEVIRGSGDGSPPAGPGAEPPKQGSGGQSSQKLNRF